MVMFGAFLSTLFPDTGPAIAVLPATSTTDLLLVEAFDVSVPAATFVTRLKFASPELRRPDRPSLAVQETLTSVACHKPSTAPHATVGAVESRLIVTD